MRPVFRSLLALVGLLSLAGCGAVGDSGGSTRTGKFVLPGTPVEVVPGGELAVRLSGLPPLAPVSIVLDADGILGAQGYSISLGASLPADAMGAIEARVSTDGAAEGFYRLLAVRAGTTQVLAIATPFVRIRTGSWLARFGGTGVESLVEAKPLVTGHVAVRGSIDSAVTFDGIPIAGRPPADAFVGVLVDGNLQGATRIGGGSYDETSDLAAAPGGGFSVAGVSQGAIPTLGSGTTVAPTAPWELEDVGFFGTYHDRGGLMRGLLAWGRTENGVAADEVEVTAVTYGSDDQAWLAVRARSAFNVGVSSLADPGPASGTVIVRAGDLGAVLPPLASLRGQLRVVAMEFDGNGDLLVVGNAGGPVSFDSLQIDFGARRAFLARYDAMGRLRDLLVPSSTNGGLEAQEMVVGPNRVFLVGEATGRTQLGNVTIDVRDGGSDGFVLALDGNLDALWARQWKWWTSPGRLGVPGVECRGVAALADGGCAVTGGSRDGADIESVRTGTGGLTAEDGAVARYGPDGGLMWVLELSGDGNQRLERVAVDAEGYLLVPGASEGAMTLRDRDGAVRDVSGFDPASSDAFLLRLDPDGRPRFAP